jgi:hypothetical protein
VSANVGPETPIPALASDGVSNPSIELAFDQLLLPASISRQTFVLSYQSPGDLTPVIRYDPVARVVTIIPGMALLAGQTYTLTINTPSSPTDLNGLRSIGGATLDSSSPSTLVFVAKAGNQPAEPSHTTDFCNDVMPIFTSTCGTAACHTGVLPAEGLVLTSPAGVLGTAIGRTAQGANTGTVASPPEPPGVVFGVDTPIVDPGTGATSGGDPANSWLLYKVLLGAPSDCSEAGVCDAGPLVAPSTYLVPWQPLSDDARTTLDQLVQGEVMPSPPATALTLDQMETLSFWISEGAPAPTTCP